MDSLVDLIILYMKTGCKMKASYQSRVDKFFAFNDRDNCRRVYEKILKLMDLE